MLSHFESMFLNPLLAAVLRGLWQATLSITVLVLLERLARGLSATCRSWLWRLVYLKLVVVLFLPWVWAIPLLPGPAASPRIATSTSITLPDQIVQEQDSVAASGVEQGRGIAPTSWTPVTIVMAIAWGMWFLSRLILLTRHWQASRRIVRNARVVTEGSAIELMRDLAKKVGVPVPRLLVAEKISSPMVIGITNPAVVWPMEFDENRRRGVVAADDIRMALAHELAHVARRDLAWNLVAAAVDAVIGFFPLLWLAHRRYAAAQEAACDQIAIDRARLERSRFAELLLRISQRPQPRLSSPAMVSLIQDRGALFLRERLMNMRVESRNRWRNLLLGATYVAALGAAVVPWTIGSRSVQAGEAAKEKVDGKTGGTTSSTTNGTTRIKASVSSRATSSAGGSAFSGGRSSGGGAAGGSSSGGGRSGGGSGGGGNASGFGAADARAKADVQITINGKDSDDAPATGTGTATKVGKEASVVNKSTNGAQVSTSREVTDEGELIRVTVQEKLRDIQIRQSDEDGLEVFIRPAKKNPDQTRIEVTAETADQLKEESPEAYKVYMKYLGSQLKRIRAGQGGAQAKAAGGEKEEESTEDDNPARRMMLNQLRDLLKDEDLPEGNRQQIEEMLNEID